MSFVTTLRALPWQKQAVAAAAVLGTILVLGVLVRTATRPPMALLYAGLDPQAAGEVIAQLDAAGVPYAVEGERVSVPADQRDRLRLRLAQEGLPRQSAAGYELLDSLSGFSTTSDMFSAAYWRAKEGELTRTLLGMPGVRAARVHIGAEARGGFARGQAPRTASVTLTAPGGLTASQVRAVQHVTALAVANLAPADVAVIETTEGLLTGAEAEDETLDEGAREARLAGDLTELLEARVGRGNARVSVAMTLSREREAWTAREMDPASAVVIETKRTQSTESEQGTEGAVTVASDLPDGDAGQAGDQNRSERGETREETRYDYAVTDRQGERLPGQVTALSVAVLINDLPPGEDGAPRPRTPEELAALRGLLEAAAGIDAGRGDRLTLRSLPFEVPALDEAEAPSLLARSEAQLWRAGQLGFLGLVALILGLFVVRPILTRGGDVPEVAALIEAEGPAPAAPRDPLAALRAAAIGEPEAAAALLNAWLEEETA